jgi:deferrochelatase/peroxidase EfeB
MAANTAWYEQHKNSLQGNILKHHGRQHAALIFFKFAEKEKLPAVKNYLALLAESGNVTSAEKQKADADQWKKNPSFQSPFFGLYLTSSGYKYLDKKMPGNGNPPRPADVDGMYLISHDAKGFIDNRLLTLTQDFEQLGIEIIHTESGRDIYDDKLPAGTPYWKKGKRLEHFGFADGISEPSFFNTTANADYDLTGAIEDYVFPEPNAPTFGSFLVFIKLEQNLRDFRKWEKSLDAALQHANPALTNGDGAALMIGRTRQGTPIAAPEKSGLDDWNSFNYDHDTEGLKCPFHAHIRKMNDRSGKSAGKDLKILRRGMPYDDLGTGPYFDLPDDKLPRQGAGLLFMSFQKDPDLLDDQLKKADETGVIVGPDKDPLLAKLDKHAWRDDLRKAEFNHEFPGIKGRDEKPVTFNGFGGFVKSLDRVDFFAPSLDFFKSLKQTDMATKNVTAAPLTETPHFYALYGWDSTGFMQLMSQHHINLANCHARILSTLTYGGLYGNAGGYAADVPPWRGEMKRYFVNIGNKDLNFILYYPIFKDEVLKISAEMSLWGDSSAVIAKQDKEIYQARTFAGNTDSSKPVHFSRPGDDYGHARVVFASTNSGGKTLRQWLEAIPNGSTGHFLFRITVESDFNAKINRYEINGVLEVLNNL